MAAKPIQIVDLFAGHGELGEVFSSLNNRESFEITGQLKPDCIICFTRT